MSRCQDRSPKISASREVNRNECTGASNCSRDIRYPDCINKDAIRGFRKNVGDSCLLLGEPHRNKIRAGCVGSLTRSDSASLYAWSSRIKNEIPRQSWII